MIFSNWATSTSGATDNNWGGYSTSTHADDDNSTARYFVSVPDSKSEPPHFFHIRLGRFELMARQLLARTKAHYAKRSAPSRARCLGVSEWGREAVTV